MNRTHAALPNWVGYGADRWVLDSREPISNAGDWMICWTWAQVRCNTAAHAPSPTSSDLDQLVDALHSIDTA